MSQNSIKNPTKSVLEVYRRRIGGTRLGSWLPSRKYARKLDGRKSVIYRLPWIPKKAQMGPLGDTHTHTHMRNPPLQQYKYIDQLHSYKTL